MSALEERPGDSAVNINTQTLNSQSTNVLRYSKDVLLSLHDSPLVCTPENMPPLSSWFGEEAGSPAVAKNILNSSVVSRSTDKSIILGPSKTNFASSLYGGLKHTTDSKEGATSSTSKSSSNSSRLRQEDSIRAYTNSNNNRQPRGPNYVGEKGFHYHHHNSRQDKGNGNLDRRSSNNYSSNKRYSQHHHHPNHYTDQQGTDRQSINSSASSRKEYNRDQRANNRLSHANYNDGHDRDQERIPEWMDYNPDTKTTTAANDKTALNNDYTNDLEAWKSSMKKKEGLDDTANKQPIKPDSLLQDTTNDSTSLDKILDLGSLELNPSSPMSPLFDSTSTSQSSELPSKRGSRFAKFFAKREEATQASPPISSPLASVGNTASDPAQPRSISLSELFQKPDISSQQQTGPNAVNLSNQTPDLIRHGPNTPSSNIRMLSEEDVLQSLGAKKVAVSSPELSPSDSNAIGFNKVLQILSQPKPTVPSSATYSPDIGTNPPPKASSPQIYEKKSQPNGTISGVSSIPSSPIATTQQSHLNNEMNSPSPAPRESPTSDSPAKHKKVNNLFGNNLPTSVLRKMSARSPSLSSNKSGQSGRFTHSTSDSMNGSPLIGNVSSSPSPSMTATQQQYYHQQAAHSPSNNNHGYHGYSISTATTATTTSTTTINGNNNPSPQLHHHDISLGAPSSTARSRINEMMMMNPHQAPRNQSANGYDTMMQQQMYRTATETTGMPPPHRVLPPTMQHSGSSGMNAPLNRMMSHQFIQQQQQQQQQLGSNMDGSFISHPPPPPQQMMGMPGMMPPPHLQMPPQGQASNTGNTMPPPPPFMQPMPRMPPPPPLPMGMPQQMYASKNQGWNRQ